jgi:glyoxylase-like metal-dependent hydrolase (beta-lactamase superfamily II)
MEMSQLTDCVWMLRFRVGQAYILRLPHGYALIDCGWAGAEQQILDALAGVGGAPGDLRGILLTHGHPDHYGSAAALVEATGAQVLAGAADAPVIRGHATMPDPVLLDWERPIHEVNSVGPAAPPVRVDRELSDGDTLDWGVPARVVHVPGHTPGSIALHLPSSGILFAGDTIANVGRLIPGAFHIDARQAVESFRKQAALDVDTACFGHGDPLTTGAGATLRAAAATWA